MYHILLILISYLIGSIPFGLYLGLVCCHIDLRQHGSGNIGATNAWRVLGWKVGLPAFVLDMAKGLIPVFLARHFVTTQPGAMQFLPSNLPLSPAAAAFRDWSMVSCGLAAIIGHNASIFLRFKGGKGVATTLGVALGMSWKAGVVGFIAWALVLGVTRYISVASIVGTPFGAATIYLDNGRSLPFALFGILATIFVIVKHKANMQRVRAGTEPKVGQRK